MYSSPEIARKAATFTCVACGKCSAACSMAAMYEAITLSCSPRGFVQQFLETGNALNPRELWYCLQCGNCDTACPEGVKPSLLIAFLRTGLPQEEQKEKKCCVRCGREVLPAPASTWLASQVHPIFQSQPADDVNHNDEQIFLEGLCSVCKRQVYACNNF